MKGRLLVKIASIAGAVALLTGATFAYFTSNSVTIKEVTLASATPSLQIYDSGGWGSVYDDLDIGESNMYPGGGPGDEHKFWLRNISGGDVPFGKVFPAIVSGASGDWGALKDVVQMRFGETGTGWTTNWQTLDWWYNTPNDNMLDSNLNDGAVNQRQFSVQFKMLSSASDTVKGKSLTFTLSFVAQTP